MQIISTMTPQGAAEYLRACGMSISPDTLRRGIEQGVYPFGLCIKTDGSAVYQIFKRPLEDAFGCNFNVLIGGVPQVMGVRALLDEWIAERGAEA